MPIQRYIVEVENQPDRSGATGEVTVQFAQGGISAKGDEFTQLRRVTKGEWVNIGSVRVRVRPASELLDEGEINSANWTRPELLVSTPEADRIRRLRSVLPMEEGTDILIGRSSKKNDIVLEDEHVSRRHLRIVVRGGRHFVEDLGSRWGTIVNGTRIDLSVALNHGDEVRLGRSVLRFVKFSDGFEFVPDDSVAASIAEGRGPSWRPDPEVGEDGMTLTATTLLAIPTPEPTKPANPAPVVVRQESADDGAGASISQKLSNWMRPKKSR